MRSVLKDFSSANLEGRWSEACDLMTTRARESLASIGANRGEMGGCAATLKTGVGKLDEAELKKYFEDVEVTAIKVNGPTATAKVDGETNRLAKRGGR